MDIFGTLRKVCRRKGVKFTIPLFFKTYKVHVLCKVFWELLIYMLYPEKKT